MELYKKIETYLGRVVDFENEIILMSENHFNKEGKFTHFSEHVNKWNAPEKQPTDAELDVITEYRNPRQAEIVRAERDRLISETDWTQNSDVKLSDELKEAYIIYRQKLRDISKQSGFPYDVIFPDKP